MSNHRDDDTDAKVLNRLLNGDELAALWGLVDQASALFFDSVAGEGCWQSEFSDEERRMICLRIIVAMAGELVKAESSNSRPLAIPPAEPSRRATGDQPTERPSPPLTDVPVLPGSRFRS